MHAHVCNHQCFMCVWMPVFDVLVYLQPDGTSALQVQVQSSVRVHVFCVLVVQVQNSVRVRVFCVLVLSCLALKSLPLSTQRAG